MPVRVVAAARAPAPIETAPPCWPALVRSCAWLVPVATGALALGAVVAAVFVGAGVIVFRVDDRGELARGRVGRNDQGRVPGLTGIK
jgi:hypothetical protein